MFAGGEDCTIKLFVKWSEFLQKRSMISDAVRVHDLFWFLYLNTNFAHRMCLRVGFKQILDISTRPVVTCATHIRYILDSMDPNGTRFSLTRGTVSICDLKSHSPAVYVHRDRVEQILNDGWLTVFAKLHIFKPVPFSPIPSHFAYSFSAPAQCVYPVAELNGLIYLLAKHSDLSEESLDATEQSDVSQSVEKSSSIHTGIPHTPPSENAMSTISEQFEQWDVQCMRAFDKESTVTLATISDKPMTYVGSSIDMETQHSCDVTQVDQAYARIQLDLVDLGGGVQTRSYQTLPNNISQNYAWKAVKTSKGWIMADKQVFLGDEDEDESVCFRFWLLVEELTLLSELTRSNHSNFASSPDSLELLTKIGAGPSLGVQCPWAALQYTTGPLSTHVRGDNTNKKSHVQ